MRQSILRAYSVSISEDDTFVKNEKGIVFGYTLLPGWSTDKTYRNGTLEDLCWDIMKDKKDELSEEKLKGLSVDYIGGQHRCEIKISVLFIKINCMPIYLEQILL